MILLRGFTISFSPWSGPNGPVDLAWGVRRRCVASDGGGPRLVDQRQFMSGTNLGQSGPTAIRVDPGRVAQFEHTRSLNEALPPRFR
jgi:hypothetical protein